MAERQLDSSLIFSYKGNNPVYKGNAFKVRLPPKGPTCNYHPIWFRVSTHGFWEDRKHSVLCNPLLTHNTT
jgi:hypothetical protein